MTSKTGSLNNGRCVHDWLIGHDACFQAADSLIITWQAANVKLLLIHRHHAFAMGHAGACCKDAVVDLNPDGTPKDPQDKEQMRSDPRDLRTAAKSGTCLRALTAIETPSPSVCCSSSARGRHMMHVFDVRISARALHSGDWTMMRILLRRMPIAQINSGATKDEGDPEEKGVGKCESMDRYWNPPSVHWRNGEDACMREHSMCKPSTCWIIGLRHDTYQQLTSGRLRT